MESPAQFLSNVISKLKRALEPERLRYIRIRDEVRDKIASEEDAGSAPLLKRSLRAAEKLCEFLVAIQNKVVVVTKTPDCDVDSMIRELASGDEITLYFDDLVYTLVEREDSVAISKLLSRTTNHVCAETNRRVCIDEDGEFEEWVGRSTVYMSKSLPNNVTEFFLIHKLVDSRRASQVFIEELHEIGWVLLNPPLNTTDDVKERLMQCWLSEKTRAESFSSSLATRVVDVYSLRVELAVCKRVRDKKDVSERNGILAGESPRKKRRLGERGVVKDENCTGECED